MKRRARREGSHPDDGCGLRRRGPAGRRAGPTGRTGRGSAFQIGVPGRPRDVVGAGFALPRDAGQRPALRALSALVSRSRAIPVRGRRSKRCRRWFRAAARCRSETGAPSVVGAGFALPRDAGRRPALQALLVRVSRSRAMPVGDRRSKPRRPCAGIPRRTQKKPARWRVSRGAAIAAPRGVPADFGRGQVIVSLRR